jgi:hypothetical protein
MAELEKEDVEVKEEKKENASEKRSPAERTTEKEELKVQLDTAYQALGQKFYKACGVSNGKRPAEVPRASLFNDQIAEIGKIKSKYDAIVSEELAEKGLKACPECENEVVLKSLYCNMCGFKFPVKTEDKPKPAAKPKCKFCGAELEPGSAFCAECGKKQV